MTRILALAAWILGGSLAYAGTINGNLLGPSGLPIKNGVLTFRLQQAGLVVGSGSMVPLSTACYTSTDGSVVGLPNPLALPTVAVNSGTGSVAAGTYQITLAFFDGTGHLSLPSPARSIQLTGSGSLVVSPPASFPANAAGMTVFVGSTAQGSTSGPTAAFTLSTPPTTSGAVLPLANDSSCSLAFNDTVIPYTGYDVSLVSAAGNAYPGWPQAWQLNGGPNGTVNVSAGAPLWNGVVIYPTPILSQPLNHGPQSISGLLNMSGYNLVNLGALGVGTSTPSWPVDVENGYINTNLGYLVGGSGGSAGQCLVSNGSYFGPGSCGTAPTLYYQHMQRNGSLFNQEPFLNFSTDFSLNDNAGSTRTEVGLQATGVTAGSYTNPNLTVDANGRVTAASNSAAPAVSQIEPLVIDSGICTTGNGASANCTFAVTWPTAFVDNHYALTCSPNNSGLGGLTALMFGNKTATGFSLYLQNGTASQAQTTTLTEVDCLGVHP